MPHVFFEEKMFPKNCVFKIVSVLSIYYTSCSLLYEAFVDLVAEEVLSSYSNSRECVGVTEDRDITSYFFSDEHKNG